MNVGSLFTGIGGFDLGLERAGHTIQWQCEADEWRRSVLAAHWPGVGCSPDVRDVALSDSGQGRVLGAGRPAESEQGVDRRERRSEAVDLICGGFPCQDLSVAGRRAGLAGSRSGLFYEFARIADVVLPPGGWLLVENVPGLLSSQRGRDYAVVLATLADLGFHDLAWRVLDSRHFGVAQRRRRVYILARRARGERACQVLLEPESSGGDPQTRAEAGEDVAGTLGLSSGAGGFRTTDLDGHGAFVKAFMPHRTLQKDGSVVEGFAERPVVDALDGPTGNKEPLVAYHFRTRENDTNIVWALGSHAGSNGDASNASHAAGGPVGMGIREDETPALRSGRTQAIAGAGVRRLTPVECERLQGFPDDWTAYGPDSRRYAALGDAVTVNVAEWIGRRLLETE